MVYQLERAQKAASLFQGWQETMVWSCLQGIMGSIWADSLENPVSAAAVLGDFSFFAGIPCREVVLHRPAQCKEDFRIMVPRDRNWAELVEDCYKEKARKTVRYAIKKEADVFDRQKLQAMADKVLDGCSLKMIDEELFWQCRSIEWCRDWVSQYEDYGMYQSYGLGAVLIKDREPVSGASSYSGYKGGIEIEIDTRKDCRRKGFASVCGAKLILECLKKGWYPSWDAQNRWSVSLAEKLGYHFDHEYEVYEIISGT